MTSVEIYSSPQCGYCDQAKALLKERGVAYDDFDIVADAARKDELIERLPRARALPQIFIAGEHIGGYEDLRHLDETGRLDAMLAAVAD